MDTIRSYCQHVSVMGLVTMTLWVGCCGTGGKSAGNCKIQLDPVAAREIGLLDHVLKVIVRGFHNERISKECF